ncbi:unnamed protein product [Somion occarium]|uniref:Uncharacterized protein n=1 Tax=Somion occarium TaxID=3059160 RepID=A0ABP1CPC8_9APHY
MDPLKSFHPSFSVSEAQSSLQTLYVTFLSPHSLWSMFDNLQSNILYPEMGPKASYSLPIPIPMTFTQPLSGGVPWPSPPFLLLSLGFNTNVVVLVSIS